MSGPKDLAPRETYGATCTRCGEHNEYAVRRPDFRCYGCRS